MCLIKIQWSICTATVSPPGRDKVTCQSLVCAHIQKSTSCRTLSWGIGESHTRCGAQIPYRFQCLASRDSRKCKAHVPHRCRTVAYCKCRIFQDPASPTEALNEWISTILNLVTDGQSVDKLVFDGHSVGKARNENMHNAAMFEKDTVFGILSMHAEVGENITLLISPIKSDKGSETDLSSLPIWRNLTFDGLVSDPRAIGTAVHPPVQRAQRSQIACPLGRMLEIMTRGDTIWPYATHTHGLDTK